MFLSRRVASCQLIDTLYFPTASILSWMDIAYSRVEHQQCTSCRKTLSVAGFKPSRAGGFVKTCKDCSEKDAQRYLTKKGLARERNEVTQEEGDLDEGDSNPGTDRLSVLTVNMFLGSIEAAQDELSLEAQVDISSVVEEIGQGKDLKEYANELAKKTWEKSRYRFM